MTNQHQTKIQNLNESSDISQTYRSESLAKRLGLTDDEHDHNKNYQVNMGYLVFYVFAVSLSMLELGYILAVNNQVESMLEAQLGVTDKGTSNLYTSIIGSSPTLGASIGSIFGATAIKNGRRKALIILNILCAICVVPTLILNIYTICIGRLLFGFCGGVYQVLVPRMIEETVPQNKLGAFGIVTNLAVCGGKMMSLVIGAWVPTSEEGLQTSNFWRFLYAIPLFMIALELIIFIFFIKEDTIKFSIDSSNEKDAKNLIKKTYTNKEQTEEIFKYLKKTGSKSQQNKVPLKEALFDQKYYFATWYCFGLVIFNQLCGQNAILLYSSTILKDILDPSKGGLSPTQGTMIIGIVNFLAAFAAIWPVKYFRRKVLFVFGHFSVAMCLVAVGLFSFYSVNYGVLIMICLTLCFFQTTIGPTTWIYVTEVTCNSGLGFDMLSYKAGLLAVSLSTNYLMDSALRSWGVFWLFGGCTIIGCIYHLFLMKETKFLTDKEKKKLYSKEDVIDNSNNDLSEVISHDNVSFKLQQKLSDDYKNN